jgi:putative phosphoesterase
MRFAVIGDIHSNKFALESVLEDINSKNVDFVISTGDLVGYMPFVNEVIDMIRANRVLVVQGNHDKRIADSKPVDDEVINSMSEEQIHSGASSAYTNRVITEENRKYLKNLPGQLRIDYDGLKVLVVHGSHRSINEYLYEDKEILEPLSKELDEDIIICGHTHLPYHSIINGKHVINAGSVGKPKHGDSNGVYVIITVEEGKAYSEIVKVSYDVESMVKAIEGNKMISNMLIPMLKEGF